MGWGFCVCEVSPVAKKNIDISVRIPSFSYLNHFSNILEDISLDVLQNAFLCIIGPNGGGKSTLLKMMVGLLPLGKSRIQIGKNRKNKIAYLPQRTDIDRQFPLTCEDVVAMGLWPKVGSFRPMTHDMKESIRTYLVQVGLSGYEKKSLFELSGGQFQRLLFARLMAQEATILLLDEPFAGVDSPTISDLICIMQKWHAEGKTIITVLHDLDLVKQFFPETALLAKTLIAHGPTSQVIAPDILAKALFRV
jgi:zinc/manganese transport system ATP-binding protein